MPARRFLPFSLVILCAAFIAGAPAPTFAGGSGKDKTATAKPDQEKKVYTNEDLEHMFPRTAAPEIQTAPSTAPVAPFRPLVVEPAAPLSSEQDPMRYAFQAVALTSQINALSDQIAQLRDFRATSTGLPVGLSIYAPCDGISTDNLIASLEQGRAEIASRLDDLEDTARRNGIAPGVFVEAPNLVLAAQNRVQISPQHLRDALVDRLDQLQAELAQVDGTVAEMNQEAASQRIVLLNPNGAGGNMTTNLLQNLANASSHLRTEISATADAAHQLGVPASALP